ncbi:E3 ubiquitin-protein ligase RNF185 isoform X2 [Ahaetulla prasina]|uniref:E3 ubiquitin-protein ligase RNF185 isoform X2 n=1 Tax=Ahaetulla prasina TaxID=499056 RepID=UPI002649EE26|nr:E3 ubiquitin-protein ligase RNF185 isoform X2 [Ahaetulla prasina]
MVTKVIVVSRGLSVYTCVRVHVYVYKNIGIFYDTHTTPPQDSLDPSWQQPKRPPTSKPRRSQEAGRARAAPRGRLGPAWAQSSLGNRGAVVTSRRTIEAPFRRPGQAALPTGARAAARPSAGSQAASRSRCQAAASSPSLSLASGSGAAIAKPCRPRSTLGVVVRRPLRRAGGGGGRAGARSAASRGTRIRKGHCSLNRFQAAGTELFAAGTFVAGAWRRRGERRFRFRPHFRLGGERNVRRPGRRAAPVAPSGGCGWTFSSGLREDIDVLFAALVFLGNICIGGEQRLLQDSASHRLPNQKPRMASKGPAASASTESSSAGGTSGNSSNGDSPGQDSTFECNICLDTAKDAVISLCGHLFCGWRPGQTDRCVLYVKQESAVIKLYHFMEGAALDNRTPGRKRHLDLKARDLSQKTEGASRVLGLVMEASKCHLELEHFHLAYLLQPSI